MKNVIHKTKISVKTMFYRFYLTLQLYGENGLANHALACAFGFLLSLTPMLLLLAFFIFYAFESSPGAITAFIGTIPFLGNLFDETWFSNDFFSFSGPGIPGIISVLTIIWAGRVLALAIQRGLKTIFSAGTKRTAVKTTLVTLAIESSAIILVLLVIISSRMALRIFNLADFFPRLSNMYFFTQIGVQAFSITLFGIASFFVYLLVPVNPPRKLSAFRGAFFCTLAYFCTVLILGIIINRARYNFIYGTFGNLVIILINVYFFFTFFFVGAQLAFVLDSFDALLFSRMRFIKNKALEKKGKLIKRLNNLRPYVILDKFFHPSRSSLKKYLRNYEKDEIIFSLTSTVNMKNDIYYLFEGEIEIMISSSCGSETFAGIVKADSFFGEMSNLLFEERTATIRAKTNVSVITITASLFDDILKNDNNLDRSFLERMSQRIKNTDEIINTAESR